MPLIWIINNYHDKHDIKDYNDDADDTNNDVYGHNNERVE